MRLSILPLLLAFTASLGAPVAFAATTGTLTFQGVVNAGTCNLIAGDVNRTITLPPVKVSDFDSADSAGEHDFELAADCDSDVKNVIFQFAGTPSAGNAELFAIPELRAAPLFGWPAQASSPPTVQRPSVAVRLQRAAARRYWRSKRLTTKPARRFPTARWPVPSPFLSLITDGLGVAPATPDCCGP